MEGSLLRPGVTLPVEIYAEKRVREFDRAEAERKPRYTASKNPPG
jgi:hypothetical protein